MASTTPSSARSIIRTFIRHYSAPVDSSIPANKLKYVPSSGTYPKGFRVSGTHVGVKASNKTQPDLAFITSDVPASAAAVFTTNKFQAAPVQISRSVLQSRGGANLRSIIINSGCANAVTGKGGMDDAQAMSDTATAQFQQSAQPEDHLGSTSLVMSTGVIGQRLPIKKILSKIPTAYSNLDNDHNAWLTTAKAICTTDTFPKLLSTTFTLPSTAHRDTKYRLAGMTKGAGMIHPNMATLLGILCTDAPISPGAAHSLLTEAVNRSFNSISIDGDTSTNDTVALLANGAAAPDPATPAIPDDTNSEDYVAMARILTDFAQRLSQLVVRDGEGATKFVQVSVRHAPTHADAKAIASTIARSPLVKTALYGKDANWGRILCAIGYTPNISPEAVVPTKTNVSFVPAGNSKSKDEGVLKLLVNGEPEVVDEERAARLLEDEDLEIEVDLGTGDEDAKYWFCDFSHELRVREQRAGNS
ncbi:Arginine biosynthesis bifunctional protein ArgJ, mitochondrial [Exophiala xenobiotica]|nr:Arginine biosynthesis bifunctional protein ArgJ, mitochondrial [Exophiala xenobiotica]KAK5248943.1 Arginine biosynthesis bifunctional protein ArgJ, mitochondrial [Exophiala xenobiotica]KAK5348195.1 Arginine biosynthesis bifunctional protein ArgJ, mitochondrial [Exophiala xenobiotica]KAK5362693.1 Arginine biosynthesis bifunctional protein ArgJ, mitochondrial [Exophiala xenobiotica]KAK5366000.1 Arginine biosynthesis bifunctional protein ArgJ, mitochondrial [Exophiala xenobiotica]